MRVQESLHLSDAETMEVTHFERGHGLISTNNNNIMVEFKASPLEKELITTDRRELKGLLTAKKGKPLYYSSFTGVPASGTPISFILTLYDCRGVV